MNQFIVIIIFLAATFSWRRFVPNHVRNKVVPWAFALMICNICCSTFYSGGVHGILGLLNYILFAILCDGLGMGYKNYNPAWRAMVVFWTYMIFSSTWGRYVLDGYSYWVLCFVSSFCVGYFVSFWFLRTPGGLHKVSFQIVILSILVVFIYVRHGALTAEDVSTRLEFDVDLLAEGVRFNQNAVAMYMILLMSFVVVSYMRTTISRKDMAVKLIALGVMVPLTLLLLRSGSRGGALCLVPIALYSLSSTGNTLKNVKRIAWLLAGTALIIILVMRTFKDQDKIRAFSLSGDDNVNYYTQGDQITSGRLSMWQRNIESMEPWQIVIGRGLSSCNEETGRVTAGNAHSIYMTVFYNSGIIGLFLMFVSICLFLREAHRSGDRGRLAKMFVFIWLIHGIGESWGMVGGGMAILAGIGFGLVSRCRITNYEFIDFRYPQGCYRI